MSSWGWGFSVLDSLKTAVVGNYYNNEKPQEEPPGNSFVFLHEVVFDDPSLDKDEYWQHVMEPGFDFFIYDSHQGDTKPSEISYRLEDTVAHRETEVEVVRGDGFGFAGYFLEDEKSKQPIIYISRQKKHHDGTHRIVYENEFINGWQDYVKRMNGVVTLVDHPSEENPKRFLQKFYIEMEISVGWNTGSWISKGVGYFTDTIAISTIQQTFKEKVNLLPIYFISFKEKTEYKKKMANNEQ
jgi:hypothetical protein